MKVVDHLSNNFLSHMEYGFRLIRSHADTLNVIERISEARDKNKNDERIRNFKDIYKGWHRELLRKPIRYRNRII